MTIHCAESILDPALPDGTEQVNAWAIGATVAISITRADVPNPVVSASIEGGYVRLVTEFDHDISAAPPGYLQWQATVSLSGFANPVLNGNIALAEVADRKTLLVKPASPVGSITLTGNEVLNEVLDDAVVGWQFPQIVSAQELRYPAPSSITRNVTINSPKVSRDVRLWASLSFDTAIKSYTREQPDGQYRIEPFDAACLYITPAKTASLSKDRNAKSEALAEINPNVHMRQMLLDGFSVYAFIPCEKSGGAVKAIDLCQGKVLAAVLRTFQGLILPRPELAGGAPFAIQFKDHGFHYFDGANYVHEYNFEAPVQITNQDGVDPTEVTASVWQETQTAQEVVQSGGLYRVGSVAFREVDFSSIKMKDKPQALRASYVMGDD